MVTTRTIPVQVDGEAVRLNPCTIEITHLNKVEIENDKSGTSYIKARILAKKKARRKMCEQVKNQRSNQWENVNSGRGTREGS